MKLYRTHSFATIYTCRSPEKMPIVNRHQCHVYYIHSLVYIIYTALLYELLPALPPQYN